MENKSPSVNLLKTKGNDFVDKFISWALTMGRMVIIFTETIALVAFLYRFVLDRQLIDQKDRINQQAAFVKQYEPSEKKYRNLQSRLSVIGQLQNQPITVVQIFTDMVNIAPSGITFNTLSLSAEVVHAEIQVQSIGSLTAFVNKIKQDPDIQTVSIDKIENKTLDARIIVSLSAKLKNPKLLSTK